MIHALKTFTESIALFVFYAWLFNALIAIGGVTFAAIIGLAILIA